MKFLRGLIKFFASPFFVGLFITFIFSYSTFRYYSNINSVEVMNMQFLMETIDFLHKYSVDTRLKWRGQKKRDSRIAILAVDEESLEKIGHWPWPRNVIGQALERLFAYDAKLAAFDIIFAEEDQKSAVPLLEDFRDLALSQNIDSPALYKAINKKLVESDTDQLFSQTLAKYSDRVVMGTYAELFDDSVRMEPFHDLCYDQLHKLSPAYEYWEKENQDAVWISAFEESAEIHLPNEWKQVLIQHIVDLEIGIVAEWMNASQYNRVRSNNIKKILLQYDLALDDDGLAIVIQHWAKNALPQLAPNLAAMSTKLSDPRAWDGFVKSLNQILSLRDRGEISNRLSEERIGYCRNFLTKRDEVLPQYQASWPQVRTSSEELSDTDFETGLEIFKSWVLANPVTQTTRWWLNIQPLAQSTLHSGFFNAKLDSDGTIRSSKLILRSGNHYMPSIALRSYLIGNDYYASIHFDEDPFNTPAQYKWVTGIDIFSPEGETIMTIPTNMRGEIAINYAGKKKMFPYVSVAQLLSDDPEMEISERVFNEDNEVWEIDTKKVDKAEFIKDRYFIVGATAVGLYDLRVTPFEENYPGVETHVNVLDNLLRQDFLVTHPDEERLMPLALLSLGILLSFLIAKFGAISGMVLSVMSITGILAIDKHYFFEQGQVVAIVFPLALVSVLYLFLTFYKYLTEERKRRKLKGTFQKYVSPAIVNEVLKDPSNLELGGRKQKMTVFFSDVRGFTTISEKLDPRSLSDLLNSYLTPMTDIVFKNKGTLDKYMGDAVMAFFGAPIPFEDHALMACRCALEQLEKLKELQAEYEQKGLPAIDIGIGINTGEMSVGNMGSQTVRSYTVMGDSVNLGSRLEGINKQYGTRIIISEFTYAEVKDQVTAREIDLVRVKGKVLPVHIFELICEGPPPEETQRMLEHFNKGLQLYHERKFNEAMAEFSNALNVVPDDPVSKLYIERCQNYLQSSPPDDWDGVFVMTTK